MLPPLPAECPVGPAFRSIYVIVYIPIIFRCRAGITICVRNRDRELGLPFGDENSDDPQSSPLVQNLLSQAPGALPNVPLLSMR